MEVIFILVTACATPITWWLSSRRFKNKLYELNNQFIEKDEVIQNHIFHEQHQNNIIVGLEKEIIKLETTIENRQYEKDELDELIKSAANQSIVSNKEFYENKFTDIQDKVTAIDSDFKKTKDEREQLQNSILGTTKAVGDLQSSLLNSQVRGAMGEVILADLLRSASYIEGTDYSLQKSQEDDKTPDCIINIGNKDKLIVDSKFPFEKYYAAHKETEPKKKEQFLKDHVKAIKKHIYDLSGKNYNNKIHDSYPKICMFFPLESAYIDALQIDNNLQMYAMERNIILCTASNLLLFLHFAKSQKIDEEISIRLLEVQDDLRDIYEKFPAFLEHLYIVYEAADNLISKLDALGGSAATTIVNKLVRAENNGIFSLDQKTMNRRKKVELEIDSSLSFEKISRGSEKLNNLMLKEKHNYIESEPTPAAETPVEPAKRIK